MKTINVYLGILFFLFTTSYSQTEKRITATDSVITQKEQAALTPQRVLDLLKEGNRRFVDQKTTLKDFKQQVSQTSKGQYPMAIILSCIDSRTSSEIIFDQGLGDIFSARIAGNFVNDDILGSMEFACKVTGSKLILVVGHTNCGAIKGACDNVELGNLTHVIKEIKPAVELVTGVHGERNSHNHDFVEKVSKQNVLLAIKEIRDKSKILNEMESSGAISILGAMHTLETGEVEFYK